MKYCHALKAAIDSAGLDTSEGRRGAVALAIALLEKVYFSELEELDWMEIYLHRFPELAAKECAAYENNLAALSSAASALYGAFELGCAKRLGIGNYISKYGEASGSA